MTTVAMIASWSVAAFAVILLAAQLAAHEFGFRMGRLYRSRTDGGAEGVGVVVGGMLGLLTFVLALTLSFANNRFAERRAGTLEEANAIGTAWLRAEAIGQPRGDAIARLLEDYTEVRKEFVTAGIDRAKLDEISQRTNVLQTKMWGHMAALVREQPNPVMAALMASLNDVFDMSTGERFAFNLRLPQQIFWLLIGMTLLSMAALGYQLGLRGQPLRILVFLLTGMWTLVIVDTLDLASSRVGALRTDTAAYMWTQQGFKGGVTIPPLPSP